MYPHRIGGNDDLRLGIEHLEDAVAEVVARFMVRAICPMTSIGATNMVA